MRISAFAKWAVALLVVVGLGLAAGRTLAGQSYPGTGAPVSSIKDLLDMSLKDRRGLTFSVNGQRIPGIVVSATADMVEARSQLSGRILIRIDRIDAVHVN